MDVDTKLDAKTFLYTRGESRYVVTDKPPIEPGVPAFLRGKGVRANQARACDGMGPASTITAS